MKFRFQVSVRDFDSVLTSNIETLSDEYPSLDVEDYMKLCDEVKDLANSFAHGNFKLKTGGDIDNDADWEHDESHSWLLVEIDTVAKTARLVPSEEGSKSDYRVGKAE